MTRITSLSRSKGFTLIEVMVAMLIMTVGLLGLLQSVNIAYQHNLRNRLRDEAVVIAEEEMNKIRARASFAPTTTVRKFMGSGEKFFTVTRESTSVGDSSKLRVAVHWVYKNVSSEHEIFTVQKK